MKYLLTSCVHFVHVRFVCVYPSFLHFFGQRFLLVLEISDFVNGQVKLKEIVKE